MTDPKAKLQHAVYLRVLQRMSPQQRLQKAFALTAFAKGLFAAGLARRFPHLSPAELERLTRERLARCHNRNY